MIIVAFFLAALARICLRPSRSRSPGTDADAGVCLGVRVGVGGVVGDGDVGAGAGGSQAALRHMCWAVTLSAGIVATAGSHCCKKKAQKTERIIVLKGHVSLKFDVRQRRKKVDSHNRYEFSTLLNCTFIHSEQLNE